MVWTKYVETLAIMFLKFDSAKCPNARNLFKLAPREPLDIYVMLKRIAQEAHSLLEQERFAEVASLGLFAPEHFTLLKGRPPTKAIKYLDDKIENLLKQGKKIDEHYLTFHPECVPDEFIPNGEY